MDVNSESRIIQHSIKFPYYSHPNCKLWRSIKGLRGSGNFFHELFPTRTPTTSTDFESSITSTLRTIKYLCNQRLYHFLLNNLFPPRCLTLSTLGTATRHPKHHPLEMGSTVQAQALITTHQAVEMGLLKVHPQDLPDNSCGTSKLLLR